MRKKIGTNLFVILLASLTTICMTRTASCVAFVNNNYNNANNVKVGGIIHNKIHTGRFLLLAQQQQQQQQKDGENIHPTGTIISRSFLKIERQWQLRQYLLQRQRQRQEERIISHTRRKSLSVRGEVFVEKDDNDNDDPVKTSRNRSNDSQQYQKEHNSSLSLSSSLSSSLLFSSIRRSAMTTCITIAFTLSLLLIIGTIEPSKASDDGIGRIEKSSLIFHSSNNKNNNNMFFSLPSSSRRQRQQQRLMRTRARVVDVIELQDEMLAMCENRGEYWEQCLFHGMRDDTKGIDYQWGSPEAALELPPLPPMSSSSSSSPGEKLRQHQRRLPPTW